MLGHKSTTAALHSTADLRQLQPTLDPERTVVRAQSEHYKFMKFWPLVDIVPPSITHVCLQNRGKCWSERNVMIPDKICIYISSKKGNKNYNNLELISINSSLHTRFETLMNLFIYMEAYY